MGGLSLSLCFDTVVGAVNSIIERRELERSSCRDGAYACMCGSGNGQKAHELTLGDTLNMHPDKYFGKFKDIFVRKKKNKILSQKFFFEGKVKRNFIHTSLNIRYIFFFLGKNDSLI